MKKKLFMVLPIAALLLMVCVSGCATNNRSQGDNTDQQILFENNAAGMQENVGHTLIVPAIDYKHGVYYLPANKATFGNSFSNFVAENPNLTVYCIAGDDTTGYGQSRGYWLYTRDSNK
jgi:hypothetical protein